MVDIKPDEISAILRQQLGNFNALADLEEVGTVLQVGDGIARVYGLNGVRSGELVEFESGVKAIALNLEEDNVGGVMVVARSSMANEAPVGAPVMTILAMSVVEVTESFSLGEEPVSPVARVLLVVGEVVLAIWVPPASKAAMVTAAEWVK